MAARYEKGLESRVAEIGARLQAHEEHCRERNRIVGSQFSLLFKRINWLTGLFVSTLVAMLLSGNLL